MRYFACLLRWTVAVSVCCWALDTRSAEAQSHFRAPKPEQEKLITKDGVRLGITYYASNAGKKAVPIVMLHDVKESRAVYNSLARALQQPSEKNKGSFAVLTVDLRGHGESITAVDGRGRKHEINGDRLKTWDYENMVRFDMEAVRTFLRKKNDAGELNLNKLCLVGAGLGANVATTWAEADWNAPRLPYRKQGQDVKALILASPKWSSWGMKLQRPFQHPGIRKSVAVLIVYGKQDAKAKKDAKNIYKNLVRYHDQPERGKIPDLYLYELPTKLQGSKLLVAPDFRSLPRIRAFLTAHVAEQDFEWQQRVSQ